MPRLEGTSLSLEGNVLRVGEKQAALPERYHILFSVAEKTEMAVELGPSPSVRVEGAVLACEIREGEGLCTILRRAPKKGEVG